MLSVQWGFEFGVRSVQVGSPRRSKIDQKLKSKTECLLALIFEGFGWVLGAKSGGKIEPTSNKHRSHNASTHDEKKVRLVGSWGGQGAPTVTGGILHPPKHKNQRKSPNAKVTNDLTNHDWNTLTPRPFINGGSLLLGATKGGLLRGARRIKIIRKFLFRYIINYNYYNNYNKR